VVSLRPTIRPLEPAIARWRSLGQGWAGRPSRSRRLLSLRWFARVPARGRIGAVTRCASRNAVLAHIGSLLVERRRAWFISRSNKALTTVPFPSGMVGRLLKPQLRAQHEWPGLVAQLPDGNLHPLKTNTFPRRTRLPSPYPRRIRDDQRCCEKGTGDRQPRSPVRTPAHLRQQLDGAAEESPETLRGHAPSWGSPRRPRGLVGTLHPPP
jgi:hypothetical protein